MNAFSIAFFLVNMPLSYYLILKTFLNFSFVAVVLDDDSLDVFLSTTQDELSSI